MTVKELKRAIANLPDGMEIYMAERKTEFKYGLVNSVEVKEITVSEDEEGLVGLETILVAIFDEE